MIVICSTLTPGATRPADDEPDGQGERRDSDGNEAELNTEWETSVHRGLFFVVSE